MHDRSEQVLRIGFQIETSEGHRYLTLSAPAQIKLSALSALYTDVVARQRQGLLCLDDTRAGRVVILAGNAASHVFAPAVPERWSMAIGIGAMREVFRVDPAGAPQLAHEMTLALSYDAARMAHAEALEFLSAVKTLLEEPLGMLVS